MRRAGMRKAVAVCVLAYALVAAIIAPSRPVLAQEKAANDVFKIGNHAARYDKNGFLLGWTSWNDALKREMDWYSRCPLDHGYPQFITVTFMDGAYHPDPKRNDTIPAMQNGMGILSYLKYDEFTHRRNLRILNTARAMGDYLIAECNTPDIGKYPRFTRSTGRVGGFPQASDCGSQGDSPYEIEPDKGGIAGYALLRLYEATKSEKYREQALHNARVLAATMQEGDNTHSPWPFRADYRTGQGRGDISANMSFILRLFDGLIASGYGEFQSPRERLWRWIKTYQIPSATKDGLLWTQFHEDYNLDKNRNSWSPLHLARYLLEKRDAIDPEWRQDSKTLIEFVILHFTSIRSGVPVCGEQDDDKDPWGGALSTYGATLAVYSAATHTEEYKGLAYQALTYGLYATNDDGCPGQNALRPRRGGWQEDAHTDKIHNYMDALAAFPEWGK